MEAGMTFVEYMLKNKDKVRNWIQKMEPISNSPVLNTASHRFLKGLIYEKTLSWTFPEIIHVDTDGYDSEYNGEKISIKTELKLFQVRKKQTKHIMLKNKMSSGLNFDEELATLDFDFLLLVSTVQHGVAICTKKDLIEHNCFSKSSGDQILVQVPYEILTFIVEPDFSNKKTTHDKLDIMLMEDLFDKFILSIYNEFCLIDI